MWILFAEMLLALGIIVFIMWWTMKDAVKSDAQSQRADNANTDKDTADKDTKDTIDKNKSS